jgi:energy-converting hydrogenase Eha subunit C
MLWATTIIRELTLEPGVSYTYVKTISKITSLCIMQWCGSLLCPGMVCVLCAVQVETRPAQHTVIEPICIISLILRYNHFSSNMKTFECWMAMRSQWILGYIPYFMTHSVPFLLRIFLVTWRWPSAGPKHVVSLIIKITAYRQLCFDWLTSFLLMKEICFCICLLFPIHLCIS